MTDKKIAWGDALLQLSFEEINELAEMVSTRQKVMTDEMRFDKWAVVVAAINEYVECFGAISVGGYDRDTHIDDDSIFSSPGRIDNL